MIFQCDEGQDQRMLGNGDMDVRRQQLQVWRAMRCTTAAAAKQNDADEKHGPRDLERHVGNPLEQMATSLGRAGDAKKRRM